MRFGHFDDDHREYVITTPHTPYPWINYLGNEQFFSLISHQSGGYSFYRDAKMRRLTRYRYNNVPTDAGGRYFYIAEDGDFWTPSYLPVKRELDSFEARHGLGYTRITGARGGITRRDACSSSRWARPPRSTKVTLTNTSDRRRELDAVLLRRVLPVERPGRLDQLPAQLFAPAKWRSRARAIYHKTEYRERRDHYAVYAVNAPIAGFDTDRETFLGLYNGFGEPDVVAAGASTNSVASGWHPIGSHSLAVVLEPGESTDYVFVLGYVEVPEGPEVGRPRRRQQEHPHKTCSPASPPPNRSTAALERLKEYWSGLLGSFALSSPRRQAGPDGQHLEPVPVHGHVQHVALRLVLRERDRPRHGLPRLQPGPARLRPPDPGAGARADHRHRLHPVRRRVGVPPVPAAHQAREQRDRLRLQRRPALADPRRRRSTSRRPATTRSWTSWCRSTTIPATAVPLFEHLTRSYQFTLDNLGPHGLPLIGRADWNDCLNLNCFSEEPGESFQTTGNREGRTAESVFIAGMFALHRSRVRRAGGASRARRGGRASTRGGRGHETDGAARRLGRRLVPARLRLLRRQSRQPARMPTARSSSSRRASA